MMPEQPGDENEYDSIVKGMQQRDAARNPLKQSFSAGVPQQDAIEALDLSRKTGIHPATVLGNLDNARRITQTPEDRMYDEIVTSAPKLGGWLRDPLNAAAVQGDVKNLKDIEELFTKIRYAPLKAREDDKLWEQANKTGMARGKARFDLAQEEAKIAPEFPPDVDPEDPYKNTAGRVIPLEEYQHEEVSKEYDRLKKLEEYVSSEGRISPAERLSTEFVVKNQGYGLPFLNSASKLVGGVNLIDAANRYSENKASDADVQALQEFHRIQLAEERRNPMMATRILDTAAGVTEFGGEMLATGGTSAVGKKLVLGAAEEASVGLLKRMAAKAAGSLVQLPVAGATAIPAHAIERMIPAGKLTVGDDGQLHYAQGQAESAGKAISKAVVGRFMDQYAAEILGLYQAKVPGATMETLKKSIAKEGGVEVLKFIGMNEVSQLLKEVTGVEPWRAPTVLRAMTGDTHAMEELFSTATVAFGMGAAGAAGHNRKFERSEAQAKRDNIIKYNEVLQDMGKSLAETEIFKKSPEIAQQAVAASFRDTDHEFQNVNAGVFEQKLLQAGVNPHEFAATLTGDPKALADALERGPGANLKIPTAAVIAKITADPKMSALFQGEFRQDPMAPGKTVSDEHLSQIDAEMEAERNAEKPKAAKTGEIGPGDVKDFASIQGKDVAAQAEQAGRPKAEASMIGKLVEAVYRTLGIRGSTPAEEMGQKHGPTIEGGKAEGNERGSYVPPDITKSGSLINAFKSADPSTVPHELAHHFLDILASDPKLSDTFGRFLKARGIESPEAWQKMTLEEKRPHHEAFAEAYEDWLFKGEAPSKELRSVFFRYRQALEAAYQKQGKQAKEIPPEMRDIFERLHATDEEIAAAKERLGRLEPHLAKIKNLGMSPADADKLASLMADAERESVERLDKESLSEINRQRSDEYKKTQAEVRESVGKELDQEPDRVAKSIIETGSGPDGKPIDWAAGGLKFSRDIIREKFGSEVAKAIPKELIAKEGGEDPDHVANVLNYGSGSELIQKLTALEGREAAIERRTAEIMAKMRLDPIENLSEKAREAIHNDAQQKLNLYQAEWIAKNKLPELKELQKKLANPRRYLKEVREYAERKVGEGSYRKADPRDYEADERGAHLAAEEALKRGDFRGFIAFMEKEMLAHEKYRAAVAKREAVEKVADKMRETGTKDYRSMMFKAGPQYLAQIDAFNDRFSFRNRSEDQIDRLQSLREFAESLADDGYISQIPDKLLNEAFRENWKDAPMDDILDMGDTVKNLETLAKKKNEYRANQKARELAAVGAEVAKSVQENSPGKVEQPLSSFRKEEMSKIERGRASLTVRTLSDILRMLDGYKDGGVLQQTVMRGLNEAGTDEAKRNERDTIALKKAFGEYTVSDQQKMFKDKIFVPEINDSLTKEEAIMISATLGQEGAAQRYEDGRGWGKAQLDAIKALLTKKDWQLVKAIHEIVGADAAEVAKAMEDETGLPAKMAKPIPIETPFGEIDGSYMPFMYDFRLSEKKAEVPEIEELKRGMRAAGMQAQTRHGFREARTEGVKLPLRMDFGVLFQHLTEKNHDLSYHATLRDVRNLLRSEPVKKAILEYSGRSTFDEIAKNLGDIAAGERGAQDFTEKVFGGLRRGTVASTMAFNVMQFFTDLGGITQGMRRVGSKYVLSEMKDMMTDPSRLQDKVQEVFDNSEMMRLRSKTRNREIFEVKGRIQEKGKAAMLADLGLEKLTNGKVELEDLHDFAYYLMNKAQMIQEIPVWRGAFRKAMETSPAKAGEDPVEAKKRWVSIADQAVLDSYGGGQMKDLSGLQKGNPFKRLVLATFYGFSGRTFAQAMESYKSNKLKLTKGEISMPGFVGRVAGDMAMLYAIPALYMTLVKHALTGGEDKRNSIWEKIATDQAANVLSSIPIGREAGSWIHGQDYHGPAGLRIFSIGADAVQKMKAGHVPTREANQAAGILFHYPALQVQRMSDGVDALSEGRTVNPLAPLLGAYRR